MNNELIGEFLLALEDLVRFEINQLCADENGYSFFSDVCYSGHKGDEQVQWLKQYIAGINSQFEIKSIDIAVSDIQLLTTAAGFADGDAALTFRLDIEKFFDDYDPEYWHPFSTLLNVTLVHNNWVDYATTHEVTSAKRMQFKSDGGKDLFITASPQLIVDAIRNLRLEHYKLLLHC